MTMLRTSVAQNVELIHDLIGKHGHHGVEIVGVIKGQPVERIDEAIRAGVKNLGINYIQEGERLRTLITETVQWHFIGHIQSRKVKELIHYDCIQSVDRSDIIQTLQLRLSSQTKHLRALIEINIGNEPQKSGISEERFMEMLSNVKDCPGIEIVGIMAMPPALEPVERRRVFFKNMRRIFDAHASHEKWTTLSMGTSEDFVIALQEGTTMIRLGNSLYGKRISS